MLRSETAAARQRRVARSGLLGRLVDAQEAERRRISRALHDEISQKLTALKLGIEAVCLRRSLPTEVRTRLVKLGELAQGLMRRVHRLAREERPPGLDDLGLLAALRLHASEWRRRSGIQLDFRARGMEGIRFTRPIETALYRTTEEALMNVLQHSGARRASVRLMHRRGVVSLLVEDDGQGFDILGASAGAHSRPGLGLLVLRKRVKRVGGNTRMASSPGRGTRLRVQIPLPRTARPAKPG
jgi:signal transduction histidine kinase